MAANYKETAVKTVQVSKIQLTAKLQTNLETHKKEYAEAMQGFREAQTQAVLVVVEEAAKGRKNGVTIHKAYHKYANLDRPSNHSESYEQAIALMEWEERDTIELSVNDFECYVRDNWDWQRSFKMSYMNYSASNA